MMVLPIVGRELRVAARRRGTYWTRLATALAAIGVAAWITLMGVLRGPQELGLLLFTVFSVIAYLYALFAGLGRTTDCLSEEKREQTLGLLFLTDLKGYDVVFGKLAASSLNAAYGLLGMVPVMAIPLLVGGVTGGEFGRVVLVSVNTLVFSLAVGMFCSAMSRDERKAAFCAVVLLLFFTAGLPLAGGVVADRLQARAHPAFFVPSPGYSAYMAFDLMARKYGQFNYYWASVACVLGLSCVFLALACYIVPRAWQVKADSAAKLRWREWLRQWTYGGRGAREQWRRKLLETNPYFWLAARDRLKSRLVWSFLAGMGGFWGWGAWRDPNSWTQDFTFIFMGTIAHTMFKVWLGTEACRRMLEDRKSGALELLLATPLSESQIIGGQCRALWSQFGRPVMVIVAADVAILLWRAYEEGWVVGWTAMILVFVTDLITLCWVGIWMGLTRRNLHRAAGGTLGLILGLPWAVAILFSALLFSPSLRTGTRGWWNGNVTMVSLMALALANNAALYTWSHGRLFSRFRELAANPSGARLRWGGAGGMAASAEAGMGSRWVVQR